MGHLCYCTLWMTCPFRQQQSLRQTSSCLQIRLYPIFHGMAREPSCQSGWSIGKDDSAIAIPIKADSQINVCFDEAMVSLDEDPQYIFMGKWPFWWSHWPGQQRGFQCIQGVVQWSWNDKLAELLWSSLVGFLQLCWADLDRQVLWWTAVSKTEY